jgi:hypothetical protein
VSVAQDLPDEAELELLAARGGVVSASKMASEARILVMGFPFVVSTFVPIELEILGFVR